MTKIAIQTLLKVAVQVDPELFCKEKPKVALAKDPDFLALPNETENGVSWSGSKYNQLVKLNTGTEVVLCSVTCACTVLFTDKKAAKRKDVKKAFLAEARAIDCSDLAPAVMACKFKTGSIGWKAHDNTRALLLGGEYYQLDRFVNVILNGTKPDAKDAKCKQPLLPKKVAKGKKVAEQKVAKKQPAKKPAKQPVAQPAAAKKPVGKPNVAKKPVLKPAAEKQPLGKKPGLKVKLVVPLLETH